MKKYLLFLLTLLFVVWSFQLLAQTSLEEVQNVIEAESGVYGSLTDSLRVRVDSCNSALKKFNKSFDLPIDLLQSDSIIVLITPSKIDIPDDEIDVNHVTLIADRLKIRNNSVIKINKILSDKTNYLETASKVYTAKNKEYAKAMKAAEERFKKTESWGRKRFWKGLGIGIVAGGIIGFVIGR